MIAGAYAGSAGKLQPRKLCPLGPPSSWSCVAATSTTPAGVTSSWTLGLRSSRAVDALLDDAAAIAASFAEVGSHAASAASKRIARSRRRIAPGARPAAPGCGSAAQADDRVALAGHALVELHDELRRQRGLAARRIARDRADARRRGSKTCSTPSGCAHARAGEQLAAAALRAEARVDGSAPYSGIAEREREIALERPSAL